MNRTGVAAVLLAGGRARRLNGDKALALLAGRPLIDHVLERIRGQVGPLAINANGDPVRFAGFGLPVVADRDPDFAGPLAGILAGMTWAARTAPACPWLLTVPTDTPFLPRDLAARLLAAADAVAAGGPVVACARSGGRRHPVAALWPVASAVALDHAVTVDGVRRVEAWLERHQVVSADWPAGPVDPFFNVNTPDDLAVAADILEASRP